MFDEKLGVHRMSTSAEAAAIWNQKCANAVVKPVINSTVWVGSDTGRNVMERVDARFWQYRRKSYLPFGS